MHDPEAPPRLRWRLLAWGIAAILLAPVLYVAAAGPAAWWSRHHDDSPDWMDIHARSLKPLYQHPQTRAPLDQYMRWWFNRPVPRSWERASLVRHLDTLKSALHSITALETQWKEQAARVESTQKRLRELLHQPDSQPGRAEEIARLQSALENEQALAAACEPVSPRYRREVVERQLAEAEQRLRQLDAQ